MSAIGKERGFMEYDRQDVTYRPEVERVRDFRAVEQPMSEADIRRQAARCMDCGTPTCHAAASGCSLSNLISDFNTRAYHGRWKEALDILLHTNCFPEFTGRICPAPCESACVLGLIRPPINICKIELAIIEEGFQRGYMAAEPPRQHHKPRVAVIGSGPAGLAAAHVVNRAGYPVVVFEKEAKPEGLLRYGIPDFKREKRVIDRRLELMRQEGIVFECNVDVGRDVSAHYLRARFDAIVLATGARVARDLLIPGREASGIHFAMDFLSQQNKLNAGEQLSEPQISAHGSRVVVIGSGDTDSDCVGTSWRQGATSVTQLEILPEPPPTHDPSTPWPLWPLMRRDSSSHKEGPTCRMWSVQTKEFLTDNGRLKGLTCVKVDWVRDNLKGPFQPRDIEGSEFKLDAELALIAMGFIGPGHWAVVDELSIARDVRGFIRRDVRHMTNVDGIFVAGDMQRDASLVVHAISDGMKTARHVISYLSARRDAPHPPQEQEPRG